ncbi:ABC transporter permease [Terriglobus albidus]|uniref:ABC transporter permease n=1 Tax=Terriglobus albidus TaxID=1592106 RepID=UPI0021DF609E|nr:ABC transporter permease [Terriglobus albidus]
MIREAIYRLRYIFRKHNVSTDVDEELHVHMAHAIEAKIASGLSPVEARRQASIEFGSMQAAREQCHDQHPRAWFDTLRQDLQFSLRSLKRDRGFTVIAVVILAIGMGANIAVFSLVNTILLRPLPFHDPEALVWIQPADADGGLSGSTYSVDAYEDLRDMNRSYSGVTGYFAFSSPNNHKLTGEGIPQPVTGIDVIPNFLDVLGVTPALGRDFRREDGLKGASPVVMLSHAFWMTRFHGDRNVINTAVSIDNAPVTVVGILPESFDFGSTFSPGTRVDVLTPLNVEMIRYSGNTLTFIGRLKPGITAQQASAETATLFPQFYWGKKFPESKGSYGKAVAVPLKEHVAGQLRRSLYVLWAAVATILLIVCVNLSNLLLGRAASRSKEFSLRFALGASRGRLIRQLLTESFLLATSGSILGVALAAAVVRWLAHQGSIALPLISELRIDPVTLLWTLLLSFIAMVLFGIVPSLRATDTGLQSRLKDSGPATSEGKRHEGLRNALVVSEIALACVLIVGAGLLLRSFLHVLDVDLGFRPSQSASITVDVPNLKKEERYNFYRNLLHEIPMIPGIESAGLSDNLPLARNRTWGPPGVKGVTYGRNERPSTFVYIISPGYLPTMGMHLRGRDISWNDNATSEPVIIINEKAARFLFPNGDAVDHMIVMSGKDVRIVGVVSDVHETNVEASSAWQVYLPIAQGWGEDGAELVIRSSMPPETLATPLLSTLRRLNPGQPAAELRPLQALVDHSTSPRRFFAFLVAIFAIVGLLLACLGIYGVISYSVARQTQEIGIRMALGATRSRVLLSVIGRTVRLSVIGIAIGTIVSFIVAKAISALLYGTEPNDPITFTGMILLLISVAVCSGYLPAKRAADVSPMTALRTE